MSSAFERLANEPRQRVAKILRPVDASTLILLDGAGGRPKVLLGRRNASLKFMPGKFVFPGGRVDPADRRVRPADGLSSGTEARLAARVGRPSPTRARALALAAIRETFEETGYLIGRKADAPAAPASGSWSEFLAAGAVPLPGALRFVARAITPPHRPRRFDTRFFVATLADTCGRVPRDIGPDAELTELVWADLDEAAGLDLPTITQVIIEELRARLAAGLDDDHPVPFYYELRRVFRREEV